MTLKIPRALLYVLAAGVVVGIGVAAFFTLREPAKDCLTASGSAVSCDTADSLSQAEYDQLQQEQAAATECRQQTGHLLRDLQELDSRLSVGLVYDEYSTQVGNTRVAYDRVPIDAMAPDCLSDVGVHLEDAMNLYVKADSLWNNCISDFNCDTDSIQPDLQAKWTEATSEINKAKSGMVSIGSSGSTLDTTSGSSDTTTTTESSDTTSDSTSKEGYEHPSGDCVSASSGESVSCDYPGAVDREVYEDTH